MKAELLYGAETRGLTEEMKCPLGTSYGFGGLEGSKFKSCGNSRAAADKGVQKRSKYVRGLATH